MENIIKNILSTLISTIYIALFINGCIHSILNYYLYLIIITIVSFIIFIVSIKINNNNSLNFYSCISSEIFKQISFLMFNIIATIGIAYFISLDINSTVIISIILFTCIRQISKNTHTLLLKITNAYFSSKDTCRKEHK